MAWDKPGHKMGQLVAAADLSTHQYKAVKVDTAGKIALAGADDELVVGVLYNKPLADEAAEVVTTGVAKMVAGAAIATAGLKLTTDADGEVIAASSTDVVIGVSLAAAGAADEVIPVLLTSPGLKA